MVKYLLSLPEIRDVKMDDGTTAFSMALGRGDLQMIRVFLNSEHLSDIDPIELAKRAVIELDRDPENKRSYLRNELVNGLKHHNVSLSNSSAQKVQISEE